MEEIVLYNPMESAYNRGKPFEMDVPPSFDDEGRCQTVLEAVTTPVETRHWVAV